MRLMGEKKEERTRTRQEEEGAATRRQARKRLLFNNNSRQKGGHNLVYNHVVWLLELRAQLINLIYCLVAINLTRYNTLRLLSENRPSHLAHASE
jgi:hypothetical protein